MGWAIGIGVFLFLLFAFPEQMLGLIGLCLLIGLAVVAYFWINDLKERRVASQIGVAASYAPSLCSPNFPIMVTTQNNTRRVVTKVYFNLVGFRPNHSDSVASAYQSSDRILKPSEAYGGCYPLPFGFSATDPAAVNWRAEVTKVQTN